RYFLCALSPRRLGTPPGYPLYSSRPRACRVACGVPLLSLAGFQPKFNAPSIISLEELIKKKTSTGLPTRLVRPKQSEGGSFSEGRLCWRIFIKDIKNKTQPFELGFFIKSGNDLLSRVLP